MLTPTGIITPVRLIEVLYVCIGVQPSILTQMGATASVIEWGLNIILLMSKRAIAVWIFAPVLFIQPNSTLSWVRE